MKVCACGVSMWGRGDVRAVWLCVMVEPKSLKLIKEGPLFPFGF